MRLTNGPASMIDPIRIDHALVAFEVRCDFDLDGLLRYSAQGERPELVRDTHDALLSSVSVRMPGQLPSTCLASRRTFSCTLRAEENEAPKAF
jgi:hypothetical protein